MWRKAICRTACPALSLLFLMAPEARKSQQLTSLMMAMMKGKSTVRQQARTRQPEAVWHANPPSEDWRRTGTEASYANLAHGWPKRGDHQKGIGNLVVFQTRNERWKIEERTKVPQASDEPRWGCQWNKRSDSVA
ncbi:hypothetical protein KQX54_013690 [Cotesia glomerata]|uniref:Secreted protein n=1 Tax=Cotesia glomerata TaxID=32391 RepID=A0AAV7IQD0_COTGL|nr:hypothetical protein KQX54_013690 [Cotesia glomerata]